MGRIDEDEDDENEDEEEEDEGNASDFPEWTPELLGYLYEIESYSGGAQVLALPEWLTIEFSEQDEEWTATADLEHVLDFQWSSAELEEIFEWLNDYLEPLQQLFDAAA